MVRKKVSVVVPYFQRQVGLLHKAVESALKQSGDFEIEIVIVDDESPIPARTELADLLPQHSDKFIIVEQKNAGCFGAANTALDHVSSDVDYIAFLDSDDEWFDRHLEHAVWALDRGYDLYFSDFYQLNQTVTAFNRAKRIDIQKHPRIHPAEPIHQYQGDMVDQIIRGSILGTSTIVYSRKTFADVRYLENYKHTGPEYILWIHLALRSNQIAFCSVPECRYGGGVNIFSESGWGTDKFLSVRHEEIRWRKYVIDNLRVSNDQKKALITKIQESRIAFGKGLFHNIVHHRRVDRKLLWKHIKVDPISLFMILSSPGLVSYARARERLSSSRPHAQN